MSSPVATTMRFLFSCQVRPASIFQLGQTGTSILDVPVSLVKGATFRNLEPQRTRRRTKEGGDLFIHSELTKRAYNRNQFFLWDLGLAPESNSYGRQCSETLHLCE